MQFPLLGHFCVSDISTDLQNHSQSKHALRNEPQLVHNNDTGFSWTATFRGRISLSLFALSIICVCVAVWCYIPITSKTHLHRPSILNSLSAGVGRLFRIILIFGSSIPHVACSRKSDATPARVKAPFTDRFSAHAVFLY